MVARTRPAAGGRVTDEVLDVRRLVRGVLRRWALVLGLGLAGLLAGAVHADGQPRVFVSQSRVLLLPSGLDSAGHPLRDIDTETFVATSSDILGQAGATFRPPRTAAQLRGMVGARSASPNILEVQAASVIPHEARTVADAVARAYVAYTNNPNANDAQMAAPRAQADALSARIRQLEEQIATQQAGLVGTDPTSPEAARGAALLDALHSEEVDSQRTLDTLNSRLGDTVLNAQAQSPGARILDPALEPGRPVSPHPLREMGEGTLGGLGGGLLLALGLERLDRRLRRRDDIARAVGAPVLCSLTVPRRLRARDSCRYVLERWRPSVVEVLALERVLHRADGSEPPEHECGSHQAEVADGDVVVLAVAEQVDDDAGQPRGDDVGGVARLHQHEDAGEDLDAADAVHHLLRRAGQDVVDPVGKVFGPVDEPVEVLVDPHRERDRGEREP